MLDAHTHLLLDRMSEYPSDYDLWFSSDGPDTWKNYKHIIHHYPTWRFGYGLLPSYIASHKEHMLRYELLFDQLRRYLDNDPSAFIGECGLDRRFCAQVSLEEQEDVCSQMICLAKEYGRMIQVHVVGYTQRAISLISNHALSVPIMWHGFTGSLETALQLKKHNIMISLGYKGLGKSTILDYHRPIPFLLETDFPQPKDEKFSSYSEVVANLYHVASTILHIDQSELEERCHEAAKIFTYRETTRRRCSDNIR